MLVDAKKMKKLRQSKNWTQQHLAEICDISTRTVQRVERDGVASHETAAAYAAVFEIEVSAFVLTIPEFDKINRPSNPSSFSVIFLAAGVFGGFAVGVATTLLFF